MVIPGWGVVPFCLLLICIASAPLLPGVRRVWEKPSFQLFIALAFGLPVAAWMASIGGGGDVLRAVADYGHFITLLFSLFVVTGGIAVEGDIRATPRNNTLFLAVGALAASFIGTTGAAMLLVRPLLSTNKERAHQAHTFVFAIMVVANTGGLLTPLGDPPLFLGMLRGVPFLWTFGLALQWAFVNGLLLLTYYAIDRKMYARETPEAVLMDDTRITPLSLRGKRHFLWLAVIVASAALLPSLEIDLLLEGHSGWKTWLPVREAVMLAAAWASWRTGRSLRTADRPFRWSPILEVAALFSGIFLTMVPALKWVAQKAPTMPLDEVSLFLLTGGLSSILDNAPTYAVFFELGKGLGGAEPVAGVGARHLTSISLGAVLCGAMTYIGNGPNFMVKAVAESGGVKMPSFAGYIVRWVIPFLLPVLAALLLVFITADVRWRAAGAGLTLVLVVLQVIRIVRHPDPHRTQVGVQRA